MNTGPTERIAAACPEPVDGERCLVARYGEAKTHRPTFVSSRLKGRADTDDGAIDVQHWAAGIAFVERCVDLNK
jgi:hypothetical protein